MASPVNQRFYGYWANTVSNLTSITVFSEVSGAIGAGSYVELWKLGQ
jgi:hypothetical protein